MSRKDRCAFWYTGLRWLTHRTRDETETETTICRRHCARIKIKESNCAWEDIYLTAFNASCLGWSNCQYSCCSYAATAISRSNALLSLSSAGTSSITKVKRETNRLEQPYLPKIQFSSREKCISSCFSPLVCVFDFPLCFHFSFCCLEIVPFLLDSLPAQKRISYSASATRVDMFGSHGHIMNFSTCRARVIRWPVGRIVHSNSHASQTKTRGQERDC